MASFWTCKQLFFGLKILVLLLRFTVHLTRVDVCCRPAVANTLFQANSYLQANTLLQGYGHSDGLYMNRLIS